MDSTDDRSVLDSPDHPGDAGSLPDFAPVELPMPPALTGSLPTNPSQMPPSTPPSFTRQMAQLVIIPAVIVLACMLLAFGFGKLAGAKESIDSHLARLRQSSGVGRIALGLQDPRYKDRWLAAYNIATMIPHTPSHQKQRLSRELIDVLDHYAQPDEQLLTGYLLLALGQLGQPDALQAIIRYLESPQTQARQGAIGALLSWPNPQQARVAIPALSTRLAADSDPLVQAQAAAALGELATPSDPGVTEALLQVMQAMGPDAREVRWNAAVALARLGDATGGRYVADVLLDRDTLAQQIATSSTPPAGRPLTAKELGAQQDRVILATLSALAKSQASPPSSGLETSRGERVSSGGPSGEPPGGPMVWDKIKQLADKDPSPSVRGAAAKMLNNRPPQGPQTPESPR